MLKDDADEESFIELIIASDRVDKWVQQIRKGKRGAVLELLEAVESSPAYAEEARQAGVVGLLTKMLSKTDDEELMEAAARVITACSGHMACGGKVREFTYDGIRVGIKEGALGDGLGAKVWSLAHVLARELVEYPALVSGKRVLEIGAGCGLNGIIAAKLGAHEVVLTDVEGPVLTNLLHCVAMNAADTASASQPTGQQQYPMHQVTDEELFEEAEEVEDETDIIGALMGLDGSKAAASSPGTITLPEPMPRSLTGEGNEGPSMKWDLGNMRVRMLDWEESLRLLEGSSAYPQLEGMVRSQAETSTCDEPPVLIEGGCADTNKAEIQARHAALPSTVLPPKVPSDETFPVVIGNEVMYEVRHARLVAAVVAHRLMPGGACLVCGAVRDLKVFETFRMEMKRRGLRVRERNVELNSTHLGVMGQLKEYEGGFLMMAIDHTSYPYTAWHRNDFV
ncbi:hypothetical protein CEUSTIGMA_g6525.t1 [Chlamydomonas eustigma]|uniref:Uncharacterized protein n=1 Tax=Chlamydomonas eustigma TaxID=1157962 RepID=A0A250X7P6_9CHLO|nr:hypothetical protein CEUSTIGMA_g6525.t1 [Chlamydomonas eustigma]|eukprot:GAX79085.1 hypothetical protein CEUSTIGMA_g6525.t1 [Chlamydomonas eustigma]